MRRDSEVVGCVREHRGRLNEQIETRQGTTKPDKTIQDKKRHDTP